MWTSWGSDGCCCFKLRFLTGKFIRISCVHQNKYSIHFGAQSCSSAFHNLVVHQEQGTFIPASPKGLQCHIFHVITERLDPVINISQFSTHPSPWQPQSSILGIYLAASDKTWEYLHSKHFSN